MSNSILITGGLGNLGMKLTRHLAFLPNVSRICGVDVQTPPADRAGELRRELQEQRPDAEVADLEFREVDLRDWTDRRWRAAAEASDVIVHLAAQRPDPRAGWDDAAASLDMNLHIGLAAVASKRCRRVVFATTNHVMGRYKDAPLADSTPPGELRPDSSYAVGTVVNIGEGSMDSTPYASAKYAGERTYRALALMDQGAGDTEFVNVRIGWCNFGDNRPSSLTATGAPGVSGAGGTDAHEAELERADRWFKEMWLSNRDFVRLFECAALASSANWPGPVICVNGMSRNRDMKWSLEEARRLLGYEPVDDVREHIPT